MIKSIQKSKINYRKIREGQKDEKERRQLENLTVKQKTETQTDKNNKKLICYNQRWKTERKIKYTSLIAIVKMRERNRNIEEEDEWTKKQAIIEK